MTATGPLRINLPFTRTPVYLRGNEVLETSASAVGPQRPKQLPSSPYNK